MSSIEDNKMTARRWLELISEHRIEEIREMTDPIYGKQLACVRGLWATNAVLIKDLNVLVLTDFVVAAPEGRHVYSCIGN